MVVQIENTTLSANSGRAIGTLPAGLRPSKKMYGATNYSQYGGLLWVDASGKVTAYAPYGGDYTGQVSFCV